MENIYQLKSLKTGELFRFSCIAPCILAEKNNELKEWLVDYVGNKVNPENNEVNVEMIIKTVAKEFPEFLLAVAEENFIRGYQKVSKKSSSDGCSKDSCEFNGSRR